MLGNVKSSNFIAFLVIISIQTNLWSSEIKGKFIDKLLSINSVKFDFDQNNNGEKESGSCLISFPSKMACKYSDGNKEIIINNKVMAIIDKKFDKIYYYPADRSSLSLILNKTELKNLILKSNLKLSGDKFVFESFISNNKINLMYNKGMNFLSGWEIVDDFNNKIIFTIKNSVVNLNLNSSIFRIPRID